MKTIIKLILLAGIFLIGTKVFAQQQNHITGTVVDEKGAPVLGATIVGDRTTIGTTSDAEGNFTLTLPETTKTIVVSYIGMITNKVQLTKSTSHYTLPCAKTPKVSMKSSWWDMACSARAI